MHEMGLNYFIPGYNCEYMCVHNTVGDDGGLLRYRFVLNNNSLLQGNF